MLPDRVGVLRDGGCLLRQIASRRGVCDRPSPSPERVKWPLVRLDQASRSGRGAYFFLARAMMVRMVASLESVRDTVATLRQAADLNRSCALRRGNVVELNAEAGTEVLITGDLHGHRLNYHRICELADLAHQPRRHLVLQEVCHGGPTFPESSGCMSYLLLEDIARLKIQFGERVHFLMSNHELAELTDFPISKGHRLLNMAFRTGLHELYGDYADEVRLAQMEFVRSAPLAVRTANGAFISHSVPDHQIESPIDASIFERPLMSEDFESHSPVFRLVWGRDYRPGNVQAFAESVGARFIIQGHERTIEGARMVSDFHYILDCCAERAGILTLPLDRELTPQIVQQGIRQLGARAHF